MKDARCIKVVRQEDGRGVVYRIPELWIAGYIRALSQPARPTKKSVYDCTTVSRFKRLYAEAIDQWIEQTKLLEEFDRENAS